MAVVSLVGASLHQELELGLNSDEAAQASRRTPGRLTRKGWSVIKAQKRMAVVSFVGKSLHQELELG